MTSRSAACGPAPHRRPGQKVSVANASYNAALSPGGSTDIGFTATYGASNAAPSGFTLNGAACTT